MYKAAVLLECVSTSQLRATVIKESANLKEFAFTAMLRLSFQDDNSQESISQEPLPPTNRDMRPTGEQLFKHLEMGDFVTKDCLERLDRS